MVKVFMNLGRAVAFLVIGAIIVASIILLRALDRPVTREEAIRISGKSELVKEGMAEFVYSRVGSADYYNSSWVEQMKGGHSGPMYEKVPQGHDIWEVTWAFKLSEGASIGYTVIVVVDAETGVLVYETKGVGFG